MGTTVTNPAVAETSRTTKKGIDLASFDTVSLYKKVPVVAKPASVEAALHLLNNDHNKLISIIHQGLQSEAIETARADNTGWLVIGEDDKDTELPFEGQLANPEDVNPMVLMFAKQMFDYDEIAKDDPKSAEKKAEAKRQSREMIKSMPKILEGLQRKAAKSKPAAE